MIQQLKMFAQRGMATQQAVDDICAGRHGGNPESRGSWRTEPRGVGGA